ncbi:Hypothetical predicted protein [Paramuricea clavata]|uniref:Uncharacterized protein n=1 Tax=Paramuricea clavata TaxID=317549 RepID=A0A7D9HTW4_PARCT|nr:Hypothetical predicted protein [Paramuricea clavata]
MANQAIQRERHPTPTVDDLIHKLNGATIFTKLDLRSGYHQLSLADESDGISPDPAKVSAIHNCPPPNSIKAVRSFLGMVTYCAKFIPNFSDLTEPLRELTRKNVPFCWTSRHAKSFNAVKAALTSATVMAYFDQTKETELITDASPFGLSAILTQKVPGSDQ